MLPVSVHPLYRSRVEHIAAPMPIHSGNGAVKTLMQKGRKAARNPFVKKAYDNRQAILDGYNTHGAKHVKKAAEKVIGEKKVAKVEALAKEGSKQAQTLYAQLS